MEEVDPRQLECGEISFLHRPGSGLLPRELSDIQRLLIVLCPDRRSRYRVLSVAGRKSSRLWGFVDLVLDSPQDLRAALSAQTYGIKSDIRHLPAAVHIGRGRYEVGQEYGDTVLSYHLSTLLPDASLPRDGRYTVSVANPDPRAWGLVNAPSLQNELFAEEEVHVALPAPLPADLQAALAGKRSMAMTTVRFLETPGAELIFRAV